MTMIYILVMIVPLFLGMIASFLVKSTFNRYSKEPTRSGLSGAEAAAEMLRRAGIHDVEITLTHGMLSDHYNPLTRTLALSEPVYYGRSIAALGVACHEAGHAIQHAHSYPFLWLRSALVPLINIGTSLYMYIFLFGLILNLTPFLYLGVLFSALTCLFTLVTLPVEWDASRRAKLALVQQGFLDSYELGGAAKVLNAAFLTYVASFVSAALQLLYWLLRAGLLGNRDD